MSCDSDSISPDDWQKHFSNLLGPKVDKTELHKKYEKFIEENIDNHDRIFEQPLTKKEVLDAVKCLKNNKSASFDLVSNEMIKASMPTLLDPIFEVFNTMIGNSMYTKFWKVDILSPIHKKNEKDNPGNYRGIAVASHFGKLFNSILKNRLQVFCDTEKIIHPEQISGRKFARSADHLTAVSFFMKKKALNGRKKLYACFFDLQKPLTQ